jgi:type I restriction enzyme, S subunit
VRVERLKHVAEVYVSNVDKKSEEGDSAISLCNYTDVYYNERITGALDFMSATATRDQRTKFGLRKGDVVLTKDSETPEDIGVSALVAEDVPHLVCGYHLAVVRARAGTADGPYLRWALASTAARQRMSAVATGVTRFGLRSEAIADLPVPLPPTSTQRAIADYLDRETARIDALIAAKQRMVELLAEQTEAAMTALVTTGTSQRGQAADGADAEWLGRTPAGWRVIPLKYAAYCDNSGAWGEDSGVAAFDMPVATTAQIAPDGTFRVSDMPIRSFSANDLTRYSCREGDILVVKSSGSATNIISGKAGRIDGNTPPFVFSNFLMRLRADDKVALPSFIYAFLKSRITRERVKRMVSATTYPNLRVEEYMSANIPIPPLADQAAIVDELEHVEFRISSMRVALTASILLLEERRQALITAAVTGQLDIPEAA